MFEFIKRKFGRTDRDSMSVVKEIYYRMNQNSVKSLFYGDYKKAHKTLTAVCRCLPAQEQTDLKEALVLCRDVYMQVWIRKHGGLSPDFSKTSYIKEALCHRFEKLSEDVLNNMIDCSIQIIYDHEPKIKARDASFDIFDAMTSENASKNKDIELMYVNDAEYGLVLDKPLFVKGFGYDKMLLNNLLTSTGEKISFQRVGSCHSDKVQGPVDLYGISTESGSVYGKLYICNYGTTMPTVAPRGYQFATGYSNV